MSDQGERDAYRARDEVLERSRQTAAKGGAMASVLSAIALLFSGYSFYETVWRAPELTVFVPPQIQYTDPDRPNSPFEVFILPLTLANHGARAGTVLSMDLEVTNPCTKQTKRFYAANTGDWAVTPRTQFAPVSLTGRDSFSGAIQFFPRVDEKIERILDFEAGSYQFRLTLATSGTPRPWLLENAPRPLEFEMQIGKLDYRYFGNNGTMSMWAADYRPTSNEAR